MSPRRILTLILILLCSGLAWAQASGPLTVTGKLYQVNPPTGGRADYTARGMLTLENKSAAKLKDLKVEAKYYSPEGELLFTDSQTASLAPKAKGDVYFLWINPADRKIDHVDAVVSGEGDKSFSTTLTLRYDY